MVTQLNPYLSFRGNAREALEFYHTIFGGDLTLNTFADYHAAEESGDGDLIMHGMITTNGGLTLMASDTPQRMTYTPGNNYSVSLSGEDETELRSYWDGISAGGTVTMPLEKAMWGDTFGMCIDKFGVSWLVNVSTGSETPAVG